MLSTLLIGLGVPVLFLGLYWIYRAEMELPELNELEQPTERWRDVFTWKELLTASVRFRRHFGASATFFLGLAMILVGTVRI